MPNTMFDITPEELDASANKLEAKITEFTKAYNAIYTATSDLRVTYKGEASETFNKKIDGYRNDFAAAEKALQNYVQFLRGHASRMKGIEEDIKQRAAALSEGR